MARGETGAVGDFLRALSARPDPDASDAELLRRFVARGEEPAFVALLQRPGPLVLGVCRRLLGDAHDVADAFQATFHPRPEGGRGRQAGRGGQLAPRRRRPRLAADPRVEPPRRLPQLRLE